MVIVIGLILAFIFGGIIGWLISIWNDTTGGMTFCDGVKSFMEGSETDNQSKIDKEEDSDGKQNGN